MTSNMRHILVTGTNSGLGFGICERLIDDFLEQTKSQQQPCISLNLIITTRSLKKGQETVQQLQAHLSSKHDQTERRRVTIQSENVELTNLLSVKALARKLLHSDLPRLDAMIFNAGIAGFSGMDWYQVTLSYLTKPIVSTTFPHYKLAMAGLVTKPQLPGGGSPQPEPPLGEVFCANVFGHYMLGHWLMPLLQACSEQKPGKIVWISSIEPRAKHLDEEDIQGLTKRTAYENTKRLIDVLTLTYDSPAASSIVQRFNQRSSSSSSPSPSTQSSQDRSSLSRPSMHIVQPGILISSIAPLSPFLHGPYVAGIWFVRVLGGIWSTLSSYAAATSASWVALTPIEEIEAEEAKFGSAGRRVKWGTGVTRWGAASVKPTEVEGWGLNGSGITYGETWWGGGQRGRCPGAVDARKEDVEDFVALGTRVWTQMEQLRKEWDERLDTYEQRQDV